MSPRSLRAALWVLAGVAGAGGTLLLRVWSENGFPGWTLCALRSVWGVPCPTCGLTRAFAALARGDLAAASGFHPLSPYLAGELGLAWVLFGIAILRPGWAVPRRLALSAAAITALAFLMFWAGRLTFVLTR